MIKKILITTLALFILTGCGKETEPQITASAESEVIQTNAIKSTKETAASATVVESTEAPSPVIEDTDYSSFFNGMNGSAVFYDPSVSLYKIYNPALAMERRSPCSTFKIISSLFGLEAGIIENEDTVRTWSGETFWNEKWNRDINFADAFQASCIWYFREVIDLLGEDRMKAELEKLSYGNNDVSDWEGRLNTNNSNRALTGFWVESSLKISPKEQVEVLERIFGESSAYGKENLEILKHVMKIEKESVDADIYGKTGLGKTDGVTVDAWFTGFIERAEGNVYPKGHPDNTYPSGGRTTCEKIYFCVYLGKSEGEEASSQMAKEIALNIIEADYQ